MKSRKKKEKNLLLHFFESTSTWIIEPGNDSSVSVRRFSSFKTSSASASTSSPKSIDA